MALNDLLSAQQARNKIGLSEERVRAVIPVIRQYVAFWREYPDLFVDFMCGGENAPKDSLHLFYYQRVFLRVAMRYKYTYAVFPRDRNKRV